MRDISCSPETGNADAADSGRKVFNIANYGGGTSATAAIREFGQGTARYTDAFELHQVQVNPSAGPAFAIESAAGLELDRVSSRKPSSESPVVRLTNAMGAILRNSRAFGGTNVFLSAGPGELNSVRLVNNVLDGAKTPSEER